MREERGVLVHRGNIRPKIGGRGQWQEIVTDENGKKVMGMIDEDARGEKS